ncbi:MAG: hypothetical protein ABSH13_11230 [Candidatus Acidiferrum sp.]|jgi:hypothetical protein
MSDSRRHLLRTFVGAAGVLAASPLLLSSQTIRPVPSPNAPDPNSPHRIGDPEPTVGPDQKTIDKQNQAQIKLEVQKLYDLVGELKEQVDKSDATSTLSLPVVKKAQQIEKLAKQIKDRAKG